MHREHSCACIKGRNSNTQFVMSFGDVLIIIWFYEKKKSDIKMIFIKSKWQACF